jgi:hypothetical protein
LDRGSTGLHITEYQRKGDALTTMPPCLTPVALPLTSEFEGEAIRQNSLAITNFVQTSLQQAKPMFGWPKYLIDQVADNNDTVEVLSNAFTPSAIANDQSIAETFLHCLNFVYTDQLNLLSECEKLLAAA